MKLKDIILQTTWPQVAIDLVSAYPKERKNIEGYAKVYCALWRMEPADTETILYIEKIADDFEPELYFNHLYLKTPEDEVTYSPMACPWEEWLGMEIAPTPNNYTPCEIVAICLFEMTWAGFDLKTIDSFKKKYLDTGVPESGLEFVETNEDLTELNNEFKPTVKWLLSNLTRFVRWGNVSIEYFGKSREWFNQHILIEAKPSDLDRIDIHALKGALKDIANEINNVIEKL